MSSELNIELFWQYLRFQNECLKRTGDSFQAFFEDIMMKADPSFTTIKPWGRAGDEKCDGISHATNTYFQVYAPDVLDAAKTIAKINEDFAGAVDNWKQLKTWTFVWSGVDKGLPPSVEKRLQELRNNNSALTVEDWSPEKLWETVKGLTPQQRAELLGPVPVPTQTTAVEIRTVLNWLIESGPSPIDPAEGFEQTALADKIELNKLSDKVASLIARSLPVAAKVEQYVSNSYDGDFSGKVAAILIAMYQRLELLEDDPDKIFVALVDGVASGPEASAAETWGAVGIVAYYFELCDIFKKQ